MHLRTIDIDARTEIDEGRDEDPDRRCGSPGRPRCEDRVSSFPNLVDLTAIRTDDELLDAIAAGRVDLPTDPIDYTLIQLLTLLAHGHTAPDHVVGQRRFGQTSPD